MEFKFLVEGDFDVIFFEALSKVMPLRLKHKENLFPYGGKSNLKHVLETHINLGVENIIITRDLNTDPPQKVNKIVEDYLTLISGAPPQKDNYDRFIVKESTITFIPIGLYGDPELNELGISSYSIEDYLIKLLLIQTPEVKEILTQILFSLRTKGLGFSRSKELFQLIKPVSRLPSDDKGATERIFGKAQMETIKKICDPIILKLQPVL